MSEQHVFDRKKGFVALPVEIMDFDLTPGAFRTLAELCRMANTDGYCWPSLHQLSDRLGRSRSAISGYIQELREAGLVSTDTQKTANGYNYRLKYCVTFWKAWRAGLSGQTRDRDERRVQPAERLVESKNHIQKNQSGPRNTGKIDHLLNSWSECFAGAAYPLVRRPPNNDLIVQTQRELASPTLPEAVSAPRVSQAMTDLWTQLRLSDDPGLRAELASLVLGLRLSQSELDRMFARLVQIWPSHWRKPPRPDHMRKLMRDTGVTATRSKLDVLGRHYKRWLLAEKTLQNTRRSCSVAA